MKIATLIGPLLAGYLKLSERHFPHVLVLNCATLMGFGFADSLPVATACFSLHVLSYVLITVMMSTLFHSELDSGTRATAESIETLIETAMIAIVAPIGGALTSGSGGLATAVLLSIVIYLFALHLCE